jgi:hypothetical protein
MNKPERQKAAWVPPKSSSTREAELFDHRRTEKVEWLNPIAMSQLQRAVKSRKTIVEIDGKKFTIEYGHWFESKITDRYEQVLIRPADNSMVPMGYVPIRKILAFDFEDKE